jgi:transposase InsO family protein
MFACQLFGIDRQVYYRKQKRFTVSRNKAEIVVGLIKELRNVMPRIGVRKLYYLLFDQLRKLKVGRDKFFAILRANHLLITPRRSYHITTNSHHRFRKHKNLIVDLSINRPNQVWAADITYIGTKEKQCYLSLVTDAYSKQILGYYVAENLHARSSVLALKMAIKSRINEQPPLIHHSDRGLQYCSDQYQKILKSKAITCSMTNNGDPYENAVAERINGILKQEFLIDAPCPELHTKKQLIKKAIEIYNNQRPHHSNYMLTPAKMHEQSQVQMRTYKKASNKDDPAAG